MLRLGAAFVPMNRAHLLRWWTPEREGRPWFYWTRRAPSEPLGSDDVDEDELDDAVRPIVLWCLRRGWKTTPSCEGHFIGTADHEGIDEALRHLAEDGQRLREGSLVLRDAETEARIQPHIPSWRGPDPIQTRHLAKQHAGQGCIGFIPTVELEWGRLAIPGWVEVVREGPLVLVSTHARTPAQVGSLWAAIERRLKQMAPL